MQLHTTLLLPFCGE